MRHGFTDTFQTSSGASCLRHDLIRRVAELIEGARARGLPVPDTCPEGSLETVTNQALYSAGVAMKKRISAHDTLTEGEPTHLASAQMQGA